MTSSRGSSSSAMPLVRQLKMSNVTMRGLHCALAADGIPFRLCCCFVCAQWAFKPQKWDLKLPLASSVHHEEMA